MAVAVALHLLVLGSLRLARPPLPSTPSAMRAETTIDLAIDPPSDPPASIEAPRASVSTEASPATVARATSPRSVARKPSAAPQVDGPGQGAVPSAAGPVAAAEVGGDHAAPSAGDVSASPAAKGAKGDALPPPLVPRAVHAPRGVFDALTAPHEASPASGAAPQLIGLARSVADASAPQRGHGTVRIDIDEGGNVTRVSATSPSWEAYARALQAKLAGRRLRVAPGAHGAVVKLAVDADVTAVPRMLTGEAKAMPCRPMDRDQAGRSDAIPNVGCNDLTALLPIPRHRVNVSIASEQSL
ncbi:Hypothetical protein A7982_02962 [Minicystis rosea]|nr:Hypothetical protein A7982_02962 [Minicystis rosea]